MAGKDQYRVKQFIDAIPGTGGIITTIASRVGCNWRTAKKYIYKHPSVLKVYEEECEKTIDTALGVIYGNIDLADKAIKKGKPGDSSDAKWLISRSRLGKARGFSERQEITGAEGGPLETRDVTYNDKQRSTILAALLDRARERTPGSDSGE